MPTSTFKFYRSSDGSAPVLSGTASSLIALLDACLVTGYGSQTPPSPAWTKPFANAGNIGCWQQGAGAGLFLSVNDNGPGVGTFKEARMSGFETLSAVATGTGPFPTAAQGVGGVAMVVARKSTTADATARDWIVVADSSTFYLFVLTGDTAATYHAFAFGDFYSLKSATDTYRCIIIGRSTENSGTASVDKLDALSVLNTVTAGHFVPRVSGGSGTSITVGKHGDATKGSASALIGTVQFPNTPDTGMYLSPVWVCESATSTIRGRMRGFYHALHAIGSFTDQQTFVGAADYLGRSFICFKSSGNSGVYMIETSATVETN